MEEEDMQLDSQLLKRRINVAAGREPADLVIKNGRIVNVFTRELIEADVAIVDGVFAGIGSYQGIEVIDAAGMFIVPGLLDGHVHIESAMVTPVQFAKTVLPHGVTAVITDPHEIANVAGVKGIQFMLDSSKHLPFDMYVMLPSSVPATVHETSGAQLEIDDLEGLLDHPRVLGLAEVMNYPALNSTDDALIAKLVTVHNHGAKVDGHAAGLDANAINIYTAAMIRTDHESINIVEAKDRLERGMYLMIREGTVAKDLINLLPIVTEHNARRCLFVTDDKHLDDLQKEGSVDHNIRLAIAHGLHPITAIQMSTLNVAECFGLREHGAIAPGYKADFLLVSNLEEFIIEQVYKNGQLVAVDGKAIQEQFEQADQHLIQLVNNPSNQSLLQSVNISTITKEHIAIRFTEGSIANIIGLVPNSLNTLHLVEPVMVQNGEFVPSIENDQLKIAVIERHHRTNNIGLGIVKGFSLKAGAIATTVGHDSHNIIVVGTNDEDILEAIQAIEQLQGALVVVENKAILAACPLAIGGILSTEASATVIQRLNEIEKALQQIGATNQFNPFLTLSFLALPVIPHLKITDLGLFDVVRFQRIPIQQ